TSPTALTAGPLGAGTYSVRATVTDAAGNSAVTPTLASVVIDTVNPVPGTLTLDSASDRGTLSSDKVTSVTTPSFSLADASDTGSGLASVQLQVSTNGTTWADTGSAVTTGLTALTAGTLASGTYSVRAKVTDKAGNSEVTGTVTGVKIDTDAPTVSSVVRADSAGAPVVALTRGATSPTFTVTFSEAVAGVSSSNFTVTGGTGITGNATVASATAVSAATDGSATAWTVVLDLATNSVHGNGKEEDATLALGTLGSLSGITDVAGNAMADGSIPASAEAFRLDDTAPAPGTLTLDSASDTGTSASDQVTKVATPTFNLADASDTGSGLASVQLQVSTNGTTWADTGSAVTTGLTSPTALTAGPLGAGTYSVRATVTDAAGNSAVTP
ncbi:MAG: hypothetical protein EBT09_14200, partial [Actinobacteria bacterium]|nr:hypothetical protein [Actinomycetota bacterium]